MTRCLLLMAVALACPLALALGDKQPPSESPAKGARAFNPTVSTTTSDGKYKVHLRPLVTAVYPGDSFQVAVHFSGKDKPLNPFGEGEAADMAKVFARMKWSVHTPDGVTYQLEGGAEDGRQKWHRGNHPIGRQATHVMHLNHQGYQTVSAWGGIKGIWASDKPFPTFDKPGTYKFTATGSLALNDRVATYKLPPIQFKVDQSVQPLNKVMDVATGALAKHVPQAKLQKHAQTESGYVREMIHEDKDGNRLVDLNTTTGGFKWGYDLVRVTVSPKGRVVRVEQREVFTCVGEGVLIDTPTGPRRIESLKRGDQVWAFDTHRDQRVATTVQTIRRGVATETLELPGGLRVTLNHPIYANGTWKAAGTLKPTDQLRTNLGTNRDPNSDERQTFRTVSKGDLTRRIGAVNVFDLTVGEPHNFIAGGIVVHNKDRVWSANLDDPWYFTFPSKPHKWKTVFAGAE